jgi:hypothetical protein
MLIKKYKKHNIILDAKSYWNSKTEKGGDCIAKIYKGEQLLFKIRYFYFKQYEILNMLKKRIASKNYL